MSDTIFLSPSSPTPGDITTLTQVCKANALQNLSVCIIGEELRPNEANTVFVSQHLNWLASPDPRITTIDNNAIEILRHETTDYTLDLTGGSVTFLSATTDIVRADFVYFPFTDEQLTEMVKQALKEIEVLIYRKINPEQIHEDYIPAICKRLYTNTLKSLLLEAKDYFSVSVGGRTINKTNIVGQFNEVINQNEQQLQAEIAVLRDYNKTDRILPTFTLTKTLKSDAEIV